MSNTLINDLLKGINNCSCGKNHNVSIEDVVIETGAIHKVPVWLKENNYKNIYVISDKNTHKACGAQLTNILKDDSIFSVSNLIYNREKDLIPNEIAIAEILINLPKNTDIIVAVGSGVINDTCKFVAHKLNIPYIIVGTAPSMDGYASNTSAMTINNLKSSLAGTLPKVIFADLDVLQQSPSYLVLAGFGDIVGKYSALKDWRLSQILNGEYLCEDIFSIVKEATDNVCSHAENIKNRTPEGMKALMDTLILTGIAMSYVGNSRPASGSEHHFSHYLEIQALFDDIQIPLHGTKVAANTVLSERLREKFVKEIDTLDLDNLSEFNLDEWIKTTKIKYRAASEEVLSLNEKKNLLSQDARKQRIESFKINKDKIVEVLTASPSSKELIDLLETVGLGYDYPYIDIDIVCDAVIYAKDLRDRYTIAHLLYDLDLSKEYSEYVRELYSVKENI